MGFRRSGELERKDVGAGENQWLGLVGERVSLGSQGDENVCRVVDIEQAHLSFFSRRITLFDWRVAHHLRASSMIDRGDANLGQPVENGVGRRIRLSTAPASDALVGLNDTLRECRIDAVCVTLQNASVTQPDRNEGPGELALPDLAEGAEETKRKTASFPSRRGIGRESF